MIRYFSLIIFVLALGSAGCSSGYHGAVQCAPYARRMSGVDLHGSAAGWWWQARGRYARSHIPSEGAVLVFRETKRMSDGHVAVVRHVLNRRKITVDQANWQPGRVEHGVMVEDVSSNASWSRVRVWWSPSGRWGKRLYSTYGFILPRR